MKMRTPQSITTHEVLRKLGMFINLTLERDDLYGSSLGDPGSPLHATALLNSAKASKYSFRASSISDALAFSASRGSEPGCAFLPYWSSCRRTYGTNTLWSIWSSFTIRAAACQWPLAPLLQSGGAFHQSHVHFELACPLHQPH